MSSVEGSLGPRAGARTYGNACPPPKVPLDPDGHLWEVAWNPALPVAADGVPVLP